MKTMTITNPKTGRETRVRAWRVEPRRLLAQLKEGGSARDLGITILGDAESLEAMEATLGGDQASNNFALSIFENALDWRLGLAALDWMLACRPRMSKPFQVACNRSGDVFVIRPSGGVWER